MNQLVYSSAIVVHIIGISVMVGATVVDFFGFRKFWSILKRDKDRATMYLDTGVLYQRLMGVGMLLIILSGITMMVYMHGVWGQQMWFRIKFGLIILVIINGLGIRRILAKRLNNTIHIINDALEITLSFSSIKRKITLVHVLQLLLFIIIFILSIFKFN